MFGSQGQQRTAILTLKQAELEVIKEEIGENPILLLDDFMSELDEKRVKSFFIVIVFTVIISACLLFGYKNNKKKRNSSLWTQFFLLGAQK